MQVLSTALSFARYFWKPIIHINKVVQGQTELPLSPTQVLFSSVTVPSTVFTWGCFIK